MAQSPNIDLYLPNRTDNVEVDTTLASNFTKIDTEIGDHTTQLADRVQQIAYAESFKIQVPEANDTARLQRAIDSLQLTGGVVQLAGKVYNVSSPLTLYSNIAVQGVGKYATKINYTGTTGACFQGQANTESDYAIIRDLNITGTTTSGILIDFKDFVSSLIDNCYLTTSGSHIVRFYSSEVFTNPVRVGYYNGITNSILWNTAGVGNVISVENVANATRIMGNRMTGGQYTLNVSGGANNAMVIGNAFESTSNSTISLVKTNSWKTQLIGNRFEGGGLNASQYLVTIAAGATNVDCIGNFYSGTLSGSGALANTNFVSDNGTYTNIQENQIRIQKAYAPLDMNGNLLTANGGIQMLNGDLDMNQRTFKNAVKMNIPLTAPGVPEAGSMYFNNVTNQFFLYTGSVWKSVTLA